MQSTAIPAPVLICVGIFVAYECWLALYGIALAAVGMLSTTGITVAVDAYGPIADNAGGIAEMSGTWMSPFVRSQTPLDAVGNTTAAMGKGFRDRFRCSDSAGSVSCPMRMQVNLACDQHPCSYVDYDRYLLIGGMLPFLFSAFTMESVSKAAYSMIEEVRTPVP